MPDGCLSSNTPYAFPLKDEAQGGHDVYLAGDDLYLGPSPSPINVNPKIDTSAQNPQRLISRSNARLSLSLCTIVFVDETRHQEKLTLVGKKRAMLGHA